MGGALKLAGNRGLLGPGGDELRTARAGVRRRAGAAVRAVAVVRQIALALKG